jgi:Tfp pilus assembly major pilin PilA
MIFISVLLTIQRSHDFNVTGWLSLILLFAIRGILAAIAIPAYQEYMARAAAGM